MPINENEKYSATKIMAEGSISQVQDLMNIDKQFDDFSNKLNCIITSIDDITENNKDIQKLTMTGESEITKISLSSQNVSSSFKEFKEQFNKFTDSIGKVTNIVNVITDITEQTKLLYLNA